MTPGVHRRPGIVHVPMSCNGFVICSVLERDELGNEKIEAHGCTSPT